METFTHFDFFNGSNPYIVLKYSELFKMFCKYYTEQTSENHFTVCGLREYNGKPNRETKKEIARNTAITWQQNFDRFNYSWGDLAIWQGFFEYIGKRYGLLKEFKENAII